MNIGLERLIEGIIATMRADVIPNVADAYARGQAVGVIDLLNNIGPRIEWARGPILDAIETKRRLLDEIGELVPESTTGVMRPTPLGPRDDPRTERDRLDARLGDVLALLHDDQTTAPRREAMALMRQHLHEEQEREMKLTRKPLFAEIASGGAPGTGGGT